MNTHQYNSKLLIQFHWLILIPVILLISSCAQLEDMLGDDDPAVDEAELAEAEEEVAILEQPDWYTNVRPYRLADGYITTAASSVSQDSARAVHQAEEISKNRLVNGTVQVLEHIREQVDVQSDQHRDSAAFIQIRYELDADDLADMAERVEEKVFYVDDPGHYQAYIALRIPKDRISEYIIRLMEQGELDHFARQYDIDELITEVIGSSTADGPAENGVE